jgi:hypothetical protein
LQDDLKNKDLLGMYDEMSLVFFNDKYFDKSNTVIVDYAVVLEAWVYADLRTDTSHMVMNVSYM